MIGSEVARVIAVMLGVSLVIMGWLLWRDPSAFLHDFLIPMGAMYAAVGAAVVMFKVVVKNIRRILWRQRAKAGRSTRIDAIDLIFDRWGPRRKYSWDETNGLISYEAARVVRHTVGDPQLSPTVVTRWVYAREDPNLLSLFVRAGSSSNDIAAYMSGTEEERATARFLLALIVDTRTA